MSTVVEHFENGYIEFKDKRKFINWVKKIYKENESESDFKLNKIVTYSDAVQYIKDYCDNFKVISW